MMHIRINLIIIFFVISIFFVFALRYFQLDAYLNPDIGWWTHNVLNILFDRPLITNDINPIFITPATFPIFWLSGTILFPNTLWLSLPAYIASILNTILFYRLSRFFFNSIISLLSTILLVFDNSFRLASNEGLMEQLAMTPLILCIIFFTIYENRIFINKSKTFNFLNLIKNKYFYISAILFAVSLSSKVTSIYGLVLFILFIMIFYRSLNINIKNTYFQLLYFCIWINNIFNFYENCCFII